MFYFIKLPFRSQFTHFLKRKLNATYEVVLNLKENMCTSQLKFYDIFFKLQQN